MFFLTCAVFTVGSLLVNGTIYFNGVLISSSGVVSFSSATINVNVLNGVAVNASCVQSNNSKIVILAPSQSGTFDLFSYSAGCSTSFNVVVDSTTSSECVYNQGLLELFSHAFYYFFLLG